MKVKIKADKHKTKETLIKYINKLASVLLTRSNKNSLIDCMKQNCLTVSTNDSNGRS